MNNRPDRDSVMLAMAHGKAIQEHKHRGYPNPDSVEGHLPVDVPVSATASDTGIERHTVEEWAKRRSKLWYTPETIFGTTPGGGEFKALRNGLSIKPLNSVPVKVVFSDEVEVVRGEPSEPSEFMAVRASDTDKVRYYDAQDREVEKVDGKWALVTSNVAVGARRLFNWVDVIADSQGAKDAWDRMASSDPRAFLIESNDGRTMTLQAVMEDEHPPYRGCNCNDCVGYFNPSRDAVTGYATGGVAPPNTRLVGESVSAAVRLQKGTAVGKSEPNIFSYQGDLFDGGTLTGSFTAYFNDPKLRLHFVTEGLNEICEAARLYFEAMSKINLKLPGKDKKDTK